MQYLLHNYYAFTWYTNVKVCLQYTNQKYDKSISFGTNWWECSSGLVRMSNQTGWNGYVQYNLCSYIQCACALRELCSCSVIFKLMILLKILLQNKSGPFICGILENSYFAQLCFAFKCLLKCLYSYNEFLLLIVMYVCNMYVYVVITQNKGIEAKGMMEKTVMGLYSMWQRRCAHRRWPYKCLPSSCGLTASTAQACGVLFGL